MVSTSRSCHWLLWIKEACCLFTTHLGKARESSNWIGCHVQALLDSVTLTPWCEVLVHTLCSFGTQFSWSRKSWGSPTPGSQGGASFLTNRRITIVLKLEEIQQLKCNLSQACMSQSMPSLKHSTYNVKVCNFFIKNSKIIKMTW